MLKRRRRNGFTLIELVVVIAILGILAGLGIMRLLDANKEAKRNTCLANRTTLSHELSYQEAQGVDPATYFASVYSTAENALNRFRCPSGGTYTLNATTLEVSCSDEDHTESSIGAAKSSSAVDMSKLNAAKTGWAALVAKAAGTTSGAYLEYGKVYTDSTGSYVAYGSSLNQNIAKTTPTLAQAVAAGVQVAKLNLDTVWTSVNKTANGKAWLVAPTQGTIYYNGTSYYAYTSTNGAVGSGVNVEYSSSQWIKISK